MLDGLFSALEALFSVDQGGGSTTGGFEPFPATEWHNDFGTLADYQVPAENGIDFSAGGSDGLYI